MSKSVKNSATCADTICLGVLNPDSRPDANQPVLYLGEAAILNVRLVNATGSDIALKSGVALEIFFQSLDVNPGNCKINLPGWTLTPKQYSLSLAYSAGSSATWGQGDANALAFQISGVQSGLSQATAGFFQVNFSGLPGGNVPGRLKMPLSLIAAPQPGNADLDIAVGLGEGGIIYVSQAGDGLIENRLLLNIINNGAHALFAGTPGQEGKPKISVSFVYGSTAGALAPDADKSAPQTGSAWTIKARESISEGNSWFPTDPDPAGKADDPVWLFQPDQNNHQLIGTGASAAVQFEFDHVISQTVPGITLMYIQFSGFKKDDHTLYNDRLFVLSISKEYLPAPGLLRFSSAVTKILINSSSQQVSIPLFWSMTGVSKIVLEFSSTVAPNIPDVTLPYGGTQPALQFGQYTLRFQGVACSGSLSVTCRAYDANGNDLNDLQQAVTIDFPPVVTAYTGDIQADGSLLLQWTTGGAIGATIAFSSDSLVPSGKMTVPAPQRPLLDNDYYALTAKGGRQNENSVPCTFKVMKFIPLDSIQVGRFPLDITVSPKGDYAFVVNASDNTVSVIEIGSAPPFKVLSPAIGIGNGAWTIGVSPKSDYVFVISSGSTSNTVSLISIKNGPPFQVLPDVIKVGGDFNSIAFTPDGNYALITNNYGSDVSVILLKNGPPFQVLPSVGIANGSQGIGISPKGDYAFVAGNSGTNILSVIEISGGGIFKALPQTISVGNGPSNIAFTPDGNYVLVTNYKDWSVSVIDLRSGAPFKVLTTIGVGCSAVIIAVSPKGDYAIVPDTHGSTMSVIEIGIGPSFKTLPAVGVGFGPSKVAFSPNGNFTFISSTGNDNVTVFGPESVSAF